MFELIVRCCASWSHTKIAVAVNRPLCIYTCFFGILFFLVGPFCGSSGVHECLKSLKVVVSGPCERPLLCRLSIVIGIFILLCFFDQMIRRFFEETVSGCRRDEEGVRIFFRGKRSGWTTESRCDVRVIYLELLKNNKKTK
jgi:hypothetical protein